jgi:hypothetical protein
MRRGYQPNRLLKPAIESDYTQDVMVSKPGRDSLEEWNITEYDTSTTVYPTTARDLLMNDQAEFDRLMARVMSSPYFLMPKGLEGLALTDWWDKRTEERELLVDEARRVMMNQSYSVDDFNERARAVYEKAMAAIDQLQKPS